MKGIGYALAKQIAELYTTGQSSLLNQLRAEMPPGIVELSNLRGLTVKKVERLHEALGITTVEELKAAGWQAHSVRGFLSAVVRKKLRLKLASETDDKGVRRYGVKPRAKV